MTAHDISPWRSCVCKYAQHTRVCARAWRVHLYTESKEREREKERVRGIERERRVHDAASLCTKEPSPSPETRCSCQPSPSTACAAPCPTRGSEGVGIRPISRSLSAPEFRPPPLGVIQICCSNAALGSLTSKRRRSDRASPPRIPCHRILRETSALEDRERRRQRRRRRESLSLFPKKRTIISIASSCSFV